MKNLLNIFKKDGLDSVMITRDEIAKLLKTTPEALDAFEQAYAKSADKIVSDNFFDVSAKEMSAALPKETPAQCPDELIGRIVDELLAQTTAYVYKDGDVSEVTFASPDTPPVTVADLMAVSEEDRPMLAGDIYRRDMDGSCNALLYHYSEFLAAKGKKKGITHYHQFRQGLDILDLDPLTYAIIGTNRNSIGHWLPELVSGVQQQTFFKIPNTTFIQVPLPLLQLTRMPYDGLTPATVKIVDRFCFNAFGLDESKEYFIKTGTYSSKYDFRNAHVKGAKEVWELGEYLLFIHYQACMMASPLSTPSTYGVSTTNEWVVREYIEDKENRPTIYQGMPLRTEYRVFVDFDDDSILGMNPYWDPAVMKKRFGFEDDADNPHRIHDYVIYSMVEERLMADYEANKERVKTHIQKLLPNVALEGQWSIDIMQNGEDFYIIDMALAANSALSECVPKGLLKTPEENWLPAIPEKAED